MLRGEDLRNARNNCGFTQAMLTEKTGYSPRQIGRLENGEGLTDLNKHVNLLVELRIVDFQNEEDYRNRKDG